MRRLLSLLLLSSLLVFCFCGCMNSADDETSGITVSSKPSAPTPTLPAYVTVSPVPSVSGSAGKATPTPAPTKKPMAHVYITYPKFSESDIIKMADIIVTGTVTKISSGRPRNDDGSEIQTDDLITYIRFTIDTCFLGDYQPGDVFLMNPGYGVRNGQPYKIAGFPDFSVGDRKLLFMQVDRSGATGGGLPGDPYYGFSFMPQEIYVLSGQSGDTFEPVSHNQDLKPISLANLPGKIKAVYNGKKVIKAPYSLTEMTTPDLMKQADLIVKGTVASAGASQWTNAKHTALYTDYTIAIDKAYKGTAGKQITLRLDKGENETTIMIDDALPDMTKGETVMLFLTQNKDGTYSLLGKKQGKFIPAKNDPNSDDYASVSGMVVQEPVKLSTLQAAIAEARK